jgi:hypothetical protein
VRFRLVVIVAFIRTLFLLHRSNRAVCPAHPGIAAI